MIVVNGSYDEAISAAAGAAEAPDTVLIEDTAWEGYEEIPGWIVEGYDTLFAEIDEQLTDAGLCRPGLVVVPTGSAPCCKPRSPTTAAVRPNRALPSSRSNRRWPRVWPRAWPPGTRPASRPPRPQWPGSLRDSVVLAWPLISNGLDAAMTVTEAADIQAAHDLAALGIPAGPCGAAPLAALRAALTGPSSPQRREHLHLEADSPSSCSSPKAATPTQCPRRAPDDPGKRS